MAGEQLDEAWARLEAAAASVELRCDTLVVPDGGFPTDYQGPRFVAIAVAVPIAVQCPQSAGVVVANRGYDFTAARLAI